MENYKNQEQDEEVLTQEHSGPAEETQSSDNETMEALLASIGVKQKAVENIEESMGGSEKVEEVVASVPSERRQKILNSVNKTIEKINEVDGKIRFVQMTDIEEGFNEMVNVGRRLKVKALEKVLKFVK